MSERVISQVKPGQLRYALQTNSGLSGEEAELYLLAAVDEVALACLLVELATNPNPRRVTPPTLEYFAQYRRLIRVLHISYQNPWEIIFQIVGPAGVVATVIQTIYNLRSFRRKTEAETEKLRAEVRKLDAETRNLPSRQAELDEFRERLAIYEKTQQQIERTSTIISTERQDRKTRELLAEVVLGGRHERHIEDVDTGLYMFRELLAHSLDVALEKAQGPDATLDEADRRRLAQEISDNCRLIASILRLDEVERSAEALDGDVRG